MRLIEVNALKEWVENWFIKNRVYHPYAKNNNIPITELYDILEQMPSAQSEITLESAIDYLHEIGWMQEHDRILTEFAQPEQKTGKWLKSYADHEAFGVRPFFRYCSECSEATVHAYNYCPNCGAKMEI